MEKSIDKNGFVHYPSLPEGWVLATIDDFHVNRKLNLGMEYVIKWDDREFYECRTVTVDLKRDWLMQFIIWDRVFINK